MNMNREPYDIDVAIAEDKRLTRAIESIMDSEENPISKKTIREIHSRFVELTTKAHNRGHWTGTE